MLKYFFQLPPAGCFPKGQSVPRDGDTGNGAFTTSKLSRCYGGTTAGPSAALGAGPHFRMLMLVSDFTPECLAPS
jgi:hypothetical protein